MTETNSANLQASLSKDERVTHYYIAQYRENGDTFFWSKDRGWTDDIDHAWSTTDQYEAKPLADAHNAKVHPVKQ